MKKKVLIVDDNKEIPEVLSRAFEGRHRHSYLL